jgi:DNA repair protein RadD
MLRDYQQRSIDQLYEWLRAGNSGNPCLVLPTGAGKSHIVAALCKDALQNWPETRVLMLTHQKELIEQNAEKMRLHWPGAPLGIYSASVGKKELDEPITFAGIQSIAKKANCLGHIDLIIIDECHLVNHKAEGGYRQLLAELKEINPNIRVIGLTATPFRLGHGLITDKPAIFDDLLEPVTIEELIHRGFLAPLRSKLTTTKLDTNGVKKRGGEYIESQLQKAVDTDPINTAIVDEVIARAEDRKAWLFFCVGIEHAENISEILNSLGVKSDVVTGKTSKKERERIIEEYKAGKIKALCNVGVLTTGFDYPDIDLIAMLRPTMSPALYVQMAGRGLRPKSHTDHCLVLDFAGAVKQHGPITNVTPPTKAGSGGEAPIKACTNCFELVHLSAKVCPHCETEFEIEAKEKAPPKLHDVDIMGAEPDSMKVTGWKWMEHVSRKTGKAMIKVRFYGALSDKPVDEYICILHQGFAGDKAKRILDIYVSSSKPNIDIYGVNDIEGIARTMNSATPPKLIRFKKNGKFHEIIDRSWDNAETPEATNSY